FIQYVKEHLILTFYTTSPEGGEWEYYRLGGKHPKEVGTEDDAKCERRTIAELSRSVGEAITKRGQSQCATWAKPVQSVS
ncbi:MAG: hypothetical protein ACLT8W_20620, partial [Bacteroides caccae]